MNRPNPAIVSEAGARSLPRWVLLLVCAAYLLPGQFGRDAWRHADLTALGFMSSLAEGRSNWWNPLLGGLPTPDGALLPYWLGALGIKVMPFLEPALAARLPFIAVLAGVLALTWYAALHLARTDAAQPVSFAFGGEATSRDYARALADAAVLALMASLGLLQLGHETTPELIQLLGVALWLFALASAPHQPHRAQGLVVLSLLLLALSGSAQFAQLLGLGGLLVCQFSRLPAARQLRVGLLLGLALGAVVATALGAWRLRLQWPAAGSLLQLVLWFSWPSLALAAWTWWRWRGFLTYRHVSVPTVLALTAMLTCVAMGGSDRALLLALPALAVLASFALPTLNRSLSAMVDWFSLFFFSFGVLYVWLYYLAMHTESLPRMTRSLTRLLSSEFQAPFDALALAAAAMGTLAWLALVRWRTSRQRAALWRSLVLPAGGTVVIWLLVMTLWLPAANYARSNQPLLSSLRNALPTSLNCIAAPEQNLSLVATLEALGRWPVKADASLATTPCEWAVKVVSLERAQEVPAGWKLETLLTRPAERGARYQVLRRIATR